MRETRSDVAENLHSEFEAFYHRYQDCSNNHKDNRSLASLNPIIILFFDLIEGWGIGFRGYLWRDSAQQFCLGTLQTTGHIKNCGTS
jgi:hypothetical protein